MNKLFLAFLTSIALSSFGFSDGVPLGFIKGEPQKWQLPLSPFLCQPYEQPPPHHLYSINYLMPVQKIKGGYLISSDHGETCDKFAFLRTNKNLGQYSPLAGWATYEGQYEYTSISGFENSIPAFKMYEKDPSTFPDSDKEAPTGEAIVDCGKSFFSTRAGCFPRTSEYREILANSDPKKWVKGDGTSCPEGYFYSENPWDGCWKTDEYRIVEKL